MQLSGLQKVPFPCVIPVACLLPPLALQWKNTGFTLFRALCVHERIFPCVILRVFSSDLAQEALGMSETKDVLIADEIGKMPCVL